MRSSAQAKTTGVSRSLSITAMTVVNGSSPVSHSMSYHHFRGFQSGITWTLSISQRSVNLTSASYVLLNCSLILVISKGDCASTFTSGVPSRPMASSSKMTLLSGNLVITLLNWKSGEFFGTQKYGL